jgi:hypothetical protein
LATLVGLDRGEAGISMELIFRMIGDLIGDGNITLNSHDSVQAVVTFWTPYWVPRRALTPE